MTEFQTLTELKKDEEYKTITYRDLVYLLLGMLLGLGIGKLWWVFIK